MKLIEEIKKDEILSNLICCECVDNKIFVSISEEREKILILNLDKYFEKNDKFEKTPNSPDCLIIQHIENEKYIVYICELKNVEYASSLNTKKKQGLKNKFKVCLEDFMTNLYPHYFLSTKYDIDLKLYVIIGYVTDKYIKSIRADFILATSPYKFNDKFYIIEKQEPFPLISKTK